jgi:hypothetical protein
MSKREKIKSKKINDVLISSEITKAQGFLFEGGDDCAVIVHRDEEDEECSIQISIGLLLEMQWEWMNNFS